MEKDRFRGKHLFPSRFEFPFPLDFDDTLTCSAVNIARFCTKLGLFEPSCTIYRVHFSSFAYKRFWKR
jgi:hypothetical protein